MLYGKNILIAGISIQSPYRVIKFDIFIKGLEDAGVVAMQKIIRRCEAAIAEYWNNHPQLLLEIPYWLTETGG